MSRPLPMIFHTADLLFEDRVSAYKNDVLGLCKPNEVSDRIAKYVAQSVEASGWQAVWRSTPKSSGHHQPFDVLVEVIQTNIILSYARPPSHAILCFIIQSRYLISIINFSLYV